MKRHTPKDVHQVFVEEGTAIDAALREGVYEAALRHKERGVPMVVAVEDQIVSVPADEVIAANAPREPRRRGRA
jgi:hypothetical protein